MRRKPGRKADADEGIRNNPAWPVLKTLVDGGADTSRLLELYYWTREPGIVELIRAYLDLPERTQRSLSTYLLNSRPKTIVSTFDTQGRLVLARAPNPLQVGAPAKATAIPDKRQASES
ncbi:MAG: hypothetical protein WC670_13770 [Pseudolabrys sp.]|jgi:hypothetical protein